MCWTRHTSQGRTGKHFQPVGKEYFSPLKNDILVNTWDIILENCFTFSSRTWMFPRSKCCILDWSSLHISSDNIVQWSWLRVSLKFPVFHIFQNLISLYLVKPTRGIARQHLIMCGKDPSSVVKSFKSIWNKTLQVDKVDTVKCQVWIEMRTWKYFVPKLLPGLACSPSHWEQRREPASVSAWWRHPPAPAEQQTCRSHY